MSLKDEVEKTTRAISNLEAAAKIEYNAVFEKEGQTDSEVVIKLDMLANIGKLCRKMRVQVLPQITVCLEVLNDMESKTSPPIIDPSVIELLTEKF